MLDRSIASGEKPFLVSAEGTITYGDIRRPQESGREQVIVSPGSDPGSVIDLMTLPAHGTQVVLCDPRLPAAESRRRRRAAREAVGREAATILFTSGTTAPARAVRLTTANWMAAVTASATHLAHDAGDVWLAVMPLHHVGGVSILYRTAFVGATVRWISRFDVAEMTKAMRGDVTIVSVVPTMLRRILDHDENAYSDLRAVLVGGGPIPAGMIDEAHSRGIPALPTYGMTETCGQVATLRPGSPPRRAAHLLPGVELRIGSDGRIEVRGGQVSPGYADTDDRPAREWFVTPDLGELAADGTLRVLGRADDVIVTGGENVSPGHVEGVLIAHDGVAAVAVVGVEDPEWGMSVAAVYVGTVEPEALIEWSRSRLTAPELPRRLHRVDRLPMTDLGKIDRRAVLAYQSGVRRSRFLSP